MMHNEKVAEEWVVGAFRDTMREIRRSGIEKYFWCYPILYLVN